MVLQDLRVAVNRSPGQKSTYYWSQLSDLLGKSPQEYGYQEAG